MGIIIDNINSHLTAIERTSLLYPARILLDRKKIKGKVLDFGCGIGKDVELLKNNGFNIDGYDPYYFTEFPTENMIFFYVLCSNEILLRRTTLC